MNIEEYRDYCLSKPGVTESFPFDQNTLVFKVYNKMFALTGVDEFSYINLKQEPAYSEQLREQYAGIKEGYHMNKKHWNSVYLDSDVTDKMLFQFIDDSYQIVLSSIPQHKRIIN